MDLHIRSVVKEALSAPPKLGTSAWATEVASGPETNWGPRERKRVSKRIGRGGGEKRLLSGAVVCWGRIRDKLGS